MSKTKRARKPSAADTPPTPAPPPGERTLARAAEATKRCETRHKRVSVAGARAGNTFTVGPPHADGPGWQATLRDTFGTTSDDFVKAEMIRLMDSQRDRGQDHVSLDVVNASLAAIDGTRPENEIEAMLAAQMAVTHGLAMDMIGRARRAETVDHLNAYGGLLTKLQRTYVA